MLRYFAIAAIIVLAIAVVVAARYERNLLRLKVASVDVKVPPKPGRLTTGGGGGGAFVGVAPWALSALPGCFTQLSETTGPAAYVGAHLPSDAERIEPPARLIAGDCTILLRGVEAEVRRGTDRFRIPPTVRFYRVGKNLAMWRTDAQGNVLRVYSLVPTIP